MNPGHVHVHPGKTFNSQPVTTPRKALGDLSNNAKKTPGAVLKHENQTLSVQKPKGPTKPSKTVKPAREPTVRKKSGVSAAQQQKQVAVAAEEFPDIELMPVKGDKGEVVFWGLFDRCIQCIHLYMYLYTGIVLGGQELHWDACLAGYYEGLLACLGICLVPRPFKIGGGEGLVHTVCTCMF